MSDVTDAGAPASDSHSVPIENVPSAPNPVSTEPQTAEEPAKVAEPKSSREALLKAQEKVEKAAPEKSEKVETKPDDKAKPVEADPKARDDKGKFAQKEAPAEVKAGEPDVPKTEAKPATESDAPARFSPDAKTAWATTPDPVKAETQRAIRELEAGIEKYRPAREFHESLREHDEQARNSGTTVKAAMDQYTAISRGLTSPDMGQKLTVIKDIFDHAGLNIREFAGAVLGQEPNQGANAAETEMRQMRQTIQRLEQQISGVSGSMQQREQQQTAKEIESALTQFAADKPDFDSLSEQIAKLLSTGMAESLPDAYSMAQRLNGSAPSAPTPAPNAPAPDLTAQTLKGSKSIAGAPSAGSDPVKRQPAPSVKEAIRRAYAKAG